MKSLQSVGPALGVTTIDARFANQGELENAIKAIANAPNGGLLLPQDVYTLAKREVIVELAKSYRLPAIYTFRAFVAAGGLMSYGIDHLQMYRSAASYVHRILRG